MVQYVITPWRDQKELLQVRQELYTQAGRPQLRDSERRHAVARISVWMQRGNCPHLIESTAILTSAMLNDNPGNSAYCVRAAYSAAFCRFVTGLLDSFQDKRRKLSMYSIAKTIGLPATYVELRHQATHEELPSLPKLRIAAQKALYWIWNYYWAQLSSKSTSGESHGDLARMFLDEDDIQKRRKLARKLSKLNRDELKYALLDMEGTTSNVITLTDMLRLLKKVLNDTESCPRDTKSTSSTGSNLDAIRAEMAAMADSITSSPERPEEQIREASPETIDLPGKGWVRWHGTWESRPIGTVVT